MFPLKPSLARSPVPFDQFPDDGAEGVVLRDQMPGPLPCLRILRPTDCPQDAGDVRVWTTAG